LKNINTDNQYFKLAKDWHFERIEAAKLNSNRWFLCFIIACLINITLSIAIIILTPLKTLVPLVIHQNVITGEAWVEKSSMPFIPANDAQTQSDIVRYITSRESYTAADLNERFSLITLLSNSQIAKSYALEQSNDNKLSPVNVLGTNGTRTVHIEDIVFIDNQNMSEPRRFKIPASNLAKVDFLVTTTDQNGIKKNEPFVATIGWIYKGLPNNEQDAWNNWDGFTVTTYRVDERNVDNLPN
jgi:type IV secretion system protein VirB8